MEDVRLARPAKVRIERNRNEPGVRVLVDGVDLAHHITAITWTAQAGQQPTATITFANVEVDVEAEDTPEAKTLTFRTEYPGHGLMTPEEISQLRKVAPAAADFLESVKPVERRERIAKAPEQAVKRTPEEWCEQYGVDILDPDGWRGKNDPPWTEPITLADFYDRALHCTVRNAVLVDWGRIARDAKVS